MISAISWVPKGASKPALEVAELPSREEIDEMIRSGVLGRSEDAGSEEEEEEEKEEEHMQGEDENQGDEVSQALAVAAALGKPSKSNSRTQFENLADGLKELNMDNYDEEDDGIELFGEGLGDLCYPSNEMDPYLKSKDDEDSEELEDMVIGPHDAVIICAHNEDDISHLEVYVFEESNDGDHNMYVHHDIMLSAFPLCTAWLDCPIKGGEKGNFIAVGSMEPSIEIWDIDIVDEVQPCLVLGGSVEKKNKKGKKKTKYKEGSHTGAVLGLAWNREYRNILASASADKQVKVWDVATGQCNITMNHHEDKVQAVAWNHKVPQVLLSGSFDRSVVMKDGRVPSHSGFRWPVGADVESLAWDPHNEHSFVVTLEDGTVNGYDIRTSKSDSPSNPNFTLHAHDKAVCTASYNPAAPNLLATGSMDKTVKLWDLSNNQPSCIASMNLKAGAVFSISFSEDCPFLLAVGGSKGKLQVWDTLSDASVLRKFGNFRPKS